MLGKPSRPNDLGTALSMGQVSSLNHYPEPTTAGKIYKTPRRDPAPGPKPNVIFDLKSGTGTTSATPTPKTAPSLSASFLAQRKSLPPRLSHMSSPNTTPIIVEGNGMMRNIDRPPPGDPLRHRTSQLHPDVQRKRSAYFENEFAAAKRDPDPVKCRVQNEAMVLAEFKTNVIINDEFTFITDLSYQLSNRYQRPISSIAVTLNHGQCMMFGGSFDSAYTLTIHALPSLIQPTTNKRNAALIQKHIEETLGVKPSRGYVRFVPTPEDSVAIGGKTVAGEIEDSGGSMVTDECEPPARKGSKGNRRISVRSISNLKASAADPSQRIPTPPLSATDSITPIPEMPEMPPTPPTPPGDEKLLSVPDIKGEKTASRRRSFRFGLFGSKQPPNSSD
ncbi:hypothetical protein DL766_007461 [Monosporascus sp. MC13-8B]|uniref:L-dopachrome isomerase n=1 Tax=Monosporascus cannonballus TaxID=155416 RepID=A0ABY0GUF3_9PEZI|nr:hypothetical protein DL762_009311 [Monosporascus cannonballus]RYO82048.1 hypothetical protein DL763_008380 [Monosporascus cannonballus]RYP23752.1 hypothetical protein DL766_007461 [Monosporascus sp. MC13-8B]